MRSVLGAWLIVIRHDDARIYNGDVLPGGGGGGEITTREEPVSKVAGNNPSTYLQLRYTSNYSPDEAWSYFNNVPGPEEHLSYLSDEAFRHTL